MASLISGDSQKRDKIYKLFQKFHVYVSLLAFIAGLVWFFILPHKLHVHKTYMSENALSPGMQFYFIQLKFKLGFVIFIL